MKLSKNQKVLCICRNGQVRSIAARYLLTSLFGFRKVITCGWAFNDRETIEELCDWADVILIIGRGLDWNLDTPINKTILIDVGKDVWGHYEHPALLRALTPKLEALVQN